MQAKKALSSVLAVLLLTFTWQVYAQTPPEGANESPKINEGSEPPKTEVGDSKVNEGNESPKTEGGEPKINEGYDIHYNALNTTFLAPKVAEKYGIQRSKNRAMLMVSVRKGSGLGKYLQTQAVEAEVTVQASNLVGQPKTIKMKLIRDGDAIYYIGTFPITDKEIFKFTIQVEPENQGSVHEIKFYQQFFVD